MRRRRKSRGVWFPNLGTAGPGEAADDDDYGAYFQFTLPAVALGGSLLSQTIVVPLTFDKIREDEADQNTTNMADLIGSEYLLKRIVGGLYIGRDVAMVADVAGTYDFVQCTAGFFVARAADETQDADRPIGSATVDELRENYSPGTNSTVREPWIWHRRWILGRDGISAAGTPNVQSASFSFPPSNVLYTGSASNHRIDAKTLRRVGQDDRLFFALTVRGLGNNWAAPNVATSSVVETGVNAHLEYRLFGQLRRAKASGRF